jgi:hypothetical protein
MTSNDTSGDRLVASIRKTKAAGKQPGAAATKPRRSPAPAKPKPAPAQRGQNSQDRDKVSPETRAPSFSFGKRVWPD